MAAAASSLPEYPLDAVGGEAHLTAVRDRLAAYATDNLRAIGDARAIFSGRSVSDSTENSPMPSRRMTALVSFS